MRIVHVFKDAFPPVRGGIERHIHDVVTGLKDHEFTVLTSSRSRRTVDENIGGVRYLRTPEYARPTSTPVTPAWIALLRDLNSDLVHMHMPNPFGEMAWLASRSRIPMIATWHAEIIGRRAVKPLFQPFQQRVLSQARAILVSSAPFAASSAPLRGHRSKVRVVPLGVDVPGGEPEATPHPLVLFVGRLAHYKGVDVLCRAMREVDATCWIAGAGTPPRGAPDNVTFLGPVTDERKYALMRAADVFAAPSTSRAEAYGLAMLEAMACGTPAVCTELGTGTTWVNSCGLAAVPGDPASLAAAISQTLARRDIFAAAALRRASELRKGQMLEALAKVYESCAPS